MFKPEQRRYFINNRRHVWRIISSGKSSRMYQECIIKSINAFHVQRSIYSKDTLSLNIKEYYYSHGDVFNSLCSTFNESVEIQPLSFFLSFSSLFSKNDLEIECNRRHLSHQPIFFNVQYIIST